MKNVSKYKVDKFILIPMFLFVIISLLTVHSSQELLPSTLNNLYIKQLIWYVLGFIIAYFIMFIGNSYIYRNIWIIYVFGVLSLLGLLLFATPINDAKCWYSIPGVGTIQPSEFMKIILIITLAKMIHKFNEEFNDPTIKEEFYFLIKVAIVVFIPSILTFLQPDTGVVLIYLIIAIIMLFISGIRYRWFAILFGGLAVLVSIVLIVYFLNTDLFINLFGTNFFLRVDRLLDWSSKTGFQLENGLSAIGAGGLFGNGLRNTPIYFPEPQTDFIFAVFANNFGFIGSLFLIGLIIFFDIYLISIAINANKNINKYIIAGIVGMLLYQQIQNIGMTFGLLPITGITLPFISYGGSSLLSYMLMAGIIFNISNESFRYTN
ncbi:MAG: FtsW/RodA/SpoVE family cell cycle protein [Bacilli bacterium]|nr:FtsW/RodA/SpoVE family cell cycle protein [Bacilli bacterium]MDD4282267.1 FtsW/RodA/SpoVE family cell cycle protein [Bacilli bacterium]MDD4718413.1 FtsW/RodA/SpoVE family cell cycle protein [Bacilli bacterium]